MHFERKCDGQFFQISKNTHALTMSPKISYFQYIDFLNFSLLYYYSHDNYNKIEMQNDKNREFFFEIFLN